MEYLLKNATVITMDSNRIFYNTDVFISNGKIRRVGYNIQPYDVKVVDCTGKYLIPGLIDSHVHMDSSEITEMLLANGITACRNMWGFPETQQWCREIDEGKRFGSKVYSTGPLTDGQEYWEHSLIVKTPEEAQKAVLDCIRGGYRYVKTYPSIPRDAFFSLMKTAANFGIRVVGHGNYNVTFRELMESGYYSLEHTSCLPQNSDEIIMLAESGMWFCPTFIVGRTIERYVHLNYNVRETKNYDSMCDYWKRDWDKITAWRKSLHRYDHLDYEEELERARIFARHSDRVLLGTDVPNPGVTGGFSVYEEMELMKEILGYSPYEILLSATVRAAECLEISSEKGKIAEGMDADLLILEKDPLKDIRNADTFTAVMKEGNLYTREECRKILERVKDYTDQDICPLM